MQSEGIELGAKVGNNEYRFLCPFHGDTTPSANINVETGLWHCQACGEGGTAIDWLMLRRSWAYREALDEVGRQVGLEPVSITRAPPAAAPPSITVSKGKLTEANVKAWHEAGLRNEQVSTWFAEHRGYTPATIEKYELGWDGQRITIPVRDENGRLVNVRRYQLGGDDSRKMIPLMAGAGPDVTTRLYPGDALGDDVLLVEGEWDALICQQHGIDARTMTIGAGNWNPTWTPLFTDRRVTIAYDNDDAGRKGALRVAAILANVSPLVAILAIPDLPAKGDATDFFVEMHRSADELRVLIAEAIPFVVPETPPETDAPTIRIPLHQASDARHRGQRLELPVLLSGKAMTPYTVPFEINVHCDMGNKRLCSMCPLQEANGNIDIKLTAAEPAVLSLVGVTNAQQYTAIKSLAKAIPSCNRPLVKVTSAINVEELRLIPEIDSSADASGDTEYVSRQGFFLGHGLLPNRSYAMRGYSHPHPKNQSTVHLLSEAEPAQDNISAFSLTPEVSQSLRIFQVPEAATVAAQFGDIYRDLTANVHRIRDRFDMQIAFDLIWHSAIAFYFNGAYVRRGWVEGMVMGDSGQGKSEMAEGLLRHYGLGQRLPAEQTSMAGLIGGLEKMGDTWMLGWGAIPLNDKRLLIIDESQGLASSTIEAMSDVRASGVAEITKIRTERTTARCRLAWLANPTSGLTLSQHNQGVLAIKELFKKPEDVRRLDLAIAVASGDVDFASSINVHHDAAVEPRYTKEACRALVLWAWSRRPDQIDFSPAATDRILEAATEMGRRYHASIPLVEPSDQRLKLARLAAATAARVYSTDPSGERLAVTVEHVDFVVAFLTRAYAARGMAYTEYSDAMRRGESMEPGETDDVRELLRDWNNRDDALEFLRTAQLFRKGDLIDGLGWDDIYAKEQIRFLQGHRLIRQTRTGYVKAPAFIALLREMAEAPTSEVVEGDYAEAPF